jgi:hypothetical protein
MCDQMNLDVCACDGNGVCKLQFGATCKSNSDCLNNACDMVNLTCL